MTPLTCTLLALAALSASATPRGWRDWHARSIRSDIHLRKSDVWYGQWTPYPIHLDQVEVLPTGGTVKVINHCDPAHPTREPTGEHVLAYNQAGDCNPVITGRWSEIVVTCKPTVDCDCVNTIKVDITQYCDSP